MITDLNKQISQVGYSYNNLHREIAPAQRSLNRIDYIYDAQGNKLFKQSSSNRTINETTEYFGNFVYIDNELAYILTETGRAVPKTAGGIEYQYFITDHLGNTRVVFNDEGHILQDNSYYPFGMRMDGLDYTAGLEPENKYLYNGKELQDDFGLDWYDYGARFYNPSLGRFTGIDPIAEDFIFFIQLINKHQLFVQFIVSSYQIIQRTSKAAAIRFPYIIYYRIEKREKAFVFAVLHMKRNPCTGKDRMK